MTADDPPIIDRRRLGAVLAPMLGPRWSDELATWLQWSASSTRRLGTERAPLTARRLTLIAGLLRERNPDSAAAVDIARAIEAERDQD